MAAHDELRHRREDGRRPRTGSAGRRARPADARDAVAAGRAIHADRASGNTRDGHLRAGHGPPGRQARPGAQAEHAGLRCDDGGRARRTAAGASAGTEQPDRVRDAGDVGAYTSRRHADGDLREQPVRPCPAHGCRSHGFDGLLGLRNQFRPGAQPPGPIACQASICRRPIRVLRRSSPRFRNSSVCDCNQPRAPSRFSSSIGSNSCHLIEVPSLALLNPNFSREWSVPSTSRTHLRDWAARCGTR